LIAHPTEAERAMGAVAYVGPLWIATFVARPRSEFCRFHSRQGMVLFIGEILASAFLAIVRWTLGIIPVAGIVIVAIVSFAVWSTAFLLSLAGIASAVKGERWRIPVLSDYADGMPL
jgi:uncharacterized membrane protein